MHVSAVIKRVDAFTETACRPAIMHVAIKPRYLRNILKLHCHNFGKTIAVTVAKVGADDITRNTTTGATFKLAPGPINA